MEAESELEHLDAGLLTCSVCSEKYDYKAVGLKLRPLIGDCYYKFTCNNCNSPSHTHSYSRIAISWLQAIYLVLYHLIHKYPEKKYFRWKEGICVVFDEYWDDLMPGKTRTPTWHNTIAGCISTHSYLFKSGFEETGQNGNWSLDDLTPPSQVDLKKKKQENSKSDKSKEKEKDRQKRKYVTKKSRLSKDDEDDYGTAGDNSSQRSIKNTSKNTLKYATKKSSHDKTAESKKWAHGDKEQKRGMREQHRVDGEDSDQDVSILTTASSSSSSSDYMSDSSTENDTYSRANLPERLVLSDAAAYSSVSGPFALMTARLVNHPGYLAKVFGSSFSNSKADGHDDACADIASDYTEFIQSKHRSKNTTTLFEKCGSFGAEYGMTRDDIERFLV